MKKQIVSIVAIFLFCYPGFCSIKKDTIPGYNVISYHYNYDYTSLDSVPIDTLLRGFQIYNPAFQNLALNNFLGNLAAPYQSTLFSDHEPLSDFIFSQSTDYDTHKPIGTLYYDAKHPYTVLTYYANFPSMQEEQKMRIVHTQNINRYFNAGASFDLVNSAGNYPNQQNNSTAITLFSSFHGQRYSIYGNVNLNSILITENGGVIGNPNQSGGILPTYLNGAGSMLKEQNIFIFQRYYLTGSYKIDSTRDNSKWNEAISLIDRMSYNKVTRSFDDNLTVNGGGDSSFYINHFNYSSKQKFGFNKDTTTDSVYMVRFENILQIAVNAYQWLKIPAEIRFGIKNQIDKFNTYSLDSVSSINPGQKYFTQTTGMDSSKIIVDPNFRNIIINNAFAGSLTDRFSKNIRWGGSGEFYFSGYKQGDLLLNGDIRQSIRHNFIFNLSGSLATTRPGYFLNNYISNNLAWHNNFKKQQSSTVKLGIYYLKRKFFIDARWDNFNNYVYFASNAKPVAANNAFLAYSLTVSKLIDWGVFHSNIRLTYQNSGNATAISLPKYSGFISAYLAFNLIGKNLILQFGTDVYYNAKYFANSYSPITSMFYAQSQTKIYYYPYTDLFLNFKIKRTRFFLKYEHIDELLSKNNGYFIPNYLIDGPSVKFGISWTFYD
jgi:hypothetical protein